MNPFIHRTEQLCVNLGERLPDSTHYECKAGGTCYVNGNGYGGVCEKYVGKDGSKNDAQHIPIISCK